jgi:hypothetical protein
VSDKQISTGNGSDAGTSAGNGGDSLASRLLKRLPGGHYAQEQLERIETRVLGELKQRLDKVDRRAAVSVLAFAVDSSGARKRGAAGPGELLRELLELASEQTQQQAEHAYYMAALKSMVPDEARILSALSDGTTYPLIHVMAGPRLGGATHPVLQNVSHVGKNAGARLQQRTPAYIRHLRDLELVETGPEDPAMKTRYQVLEAETEVRKLIERIKESGQRDQILRRTLKISELGKAMWDACRISKD